MIARSSLSGWFLGLGIVAIGIVGINSRTGAKPNQVASADSSLVKLGTRLGGSRPLEFPDDPPAPAQLLTQRLREPSRARARGPFTSVQVNVDSFGNNITGDAANEPTIAIDPTNPDRIVIAWRQFDTIASNFRQAGMAHSHDRGQTWTATTLDPGQFRSDPVLGADPDGNFFFSSLSSATSAEVFKSIDGGVSWLPPVNAFGGDKQWLAVDRTAGIGRGNVYQIWNMQFSCCPPNDFTRSTNGGASFESPITLPSPSMKWGTLEAGHDGTLYLAGATLDQSSHIVAKSTNAQNPAATPTFDFVKLVYLGGTTTWGGPNPGGLAGQVWIATDHSDGPTQGNVYILASVNPPGSDPLDVVFIRSADGGDTWSTPVRVNDDPTGNGAYQWFGTMSVAPNGRIDVVWNDTRNTGATNLSETFYTFSMDAGVTWSVNIPVGPVFDSWVGWPNQDKIGDYYHMISDDGGASLAYSTTYNGEQDVYFLRIQMVDCNLNGSPDACDLDCNASAECEEPCGFSADCNDNSVPDECEPDEDCQPNGTRDICDIGGGTSDDCNGNLVPDECDIRDGTSMDRDADDIPDECACSPSSPPQAEMIIDGEKNLVVSTKNRFLSFAAGDLKENQFIRVKFVDLAEPYDQFNDNHMWAGEPFQVSESPAHTAPGQPGYTDFWAAKLGCEKPIIATDWITLTGDCHQGVCWHSENAGEACTDDSECVRAIIHLYGEFVIPGSKYEIRVLDSLCPQEEIDNPAIAPPLELATSLWGDVCGSLVNGQWSAADGACLVPEDVMAVLSKVAVHPLAPSKTRADVIGPDAPKNMQPDLKVDIYPDVIRVLSACAARPFPAAAPVDWPCPSAYHGK